MTILSITGFFKTIIYLIGIYFLFKILARIFFPILLKHLIKKSVGNFNQAQQPKMKQEGEVTVDYVPNKNKSTDNREGDYVDYEEIK